MIGTAFLLLTIGIWQVWGYHKASFIVFLAGIFSLYGASLLSISGKIMSRQLLWNTVLLLLLEGASGAFLYTNIAEVQQTIGNRAALVLIVPLAAVAATQISQLLLVGRFRLPSRSTVLKGLLLGGICIVFAFVLNLECFNTWPQWDTFSYYYGLEPLSAKNIFRSGPNGLIVCSHVSVSFALWSFLFRLVPGITNLNALYLSNMVQIAINFFLFFLIFQRLFPGKSFFCYTLSTIAATVAPWIFGSAYAINTDHLIETAALLLLYAVFSENYTLSVLAVFALCGVREEGAGVAAVIIFLQMVYAIFRREKDKTAKFHWAYYGMCLSLGVMWLVKTLVASDWVSPEPFGKTMDGGDFFRLGFYWPYFKDVLCQTFLVNYKWIFCGLILAALIKLIVRHFRKKEKSVFFDSRYLYGMIAAAIFVSAVEHGLLVAFILPRYSTMSNALLSLLAISSIQYLAEGMRWEKAVRSCATAVLAVILLIESYITTDPVTTSLYFTMQTGRSVVSSAPQHEINCEPSFWEISAYNRQELYFVKAMDKAYAQIDAYSDGFQNATVLCSDEYIAEYGSMGSLYIIWGFGYSYVDPPMYGYWDREGGYRYLSYEMPEYSIDPLYVVADSDLSGLLEAGRDVFYIEMPWGDSVIGPLRERYPDTELLSTAEYMGWVFRVYKIQ